MIREPQQPNAVGIGLRDSHHKFVVENKPPVSFFEVHSENFFGKGGASLNFIKKIRENYPLSLHGVGLSLGSACGVDSKHLQNLKNLIAKTGPFLVSDHISWSNTENLVLNDLLPLPYTKESLQILSDNISKAQDFLQRQILVENPSTYLAFKNSEMSEEEFINNLADKTGCKILLDINNIFVSAQNNDFDAAEYLENIKPEIVGQMHLAGHSKRKVSGGEILVDTHNDVICDEVWQLYKIAVKKFKAVPTLIEWDQDLPEFAVLMDEAKKAENIITCAGRDLQSRP